MKARFLQYFSIFMLMMFISNITLANLYTQSPKLENLIESSVSNQKQEKSFWLKLVSNFVNELEETEEKSEKEIDKTTKTAIFQQNYIVYSPFEFQKNLFHSQITEWLTCHSPNLKAKISKSITLALHRFRL